MFASQTDFTNWPRALWVLEVSPLSNAGGGTPRRAATDANSFSPITPTSTPGRSVKPTFPRINTAARTRTTSRKGIPSTPVHNFFFFFIRKKNYGKLTRWSKIWIWIWIFFFFGNYHEKGFLRTQASFPRLKPDRVLSLVLPGIPVLQIPKVLQVVTLQVKFDCRVR